MFKRLLVILLTALSFSAYGQQCLISDGEVFAHGVQRTGVVPEVLRQLVGARRWQVQTESRARRLASRAQRAGQMVQEEKTIGPLLHSIRAQEAPYNLLCPRWTSDDGTVSEEHCLSGCVATAIEQVMAFYRYPEALKDTIFGWETENYTLDNLLPGTRFDWSNYLLDYRNGWTEAQGQAIALVSLAAGMAVHMGYGLGSSGASVFRAVEPLHRAFGYGMAEYFDRVLYTPSRWHAMLRHELEEGRPIVYAGHNMDLGGHAFNIDGVDSQGFYHVNWGYNGSYDGWYDLDWLNPFEPTDYPDGGFAVGFFCNQSALFMHPSEEAKPLMPDTLALDDLGIELEKLELTRQPDLQGRIAADFQFVNHGTDTVTYTYEVMTYLPTDTAIFWQADYVGLAGLTLAPGERRVQRTYLNFSVAGERIIGISHDDVTIPFSQPITIEKGTRGKLEWGEVSYELRDDGCSATFTASVTNKASAGYAADLVTYCVYADGHADEDTRHYEVLSLPAGETKDVTMFFNGLTPGRRYTMLLRCPWTVQRELSFVTPLPVGCIAPDDIRPQESIRVVSFDANGRRSQHDRSRLLIQKNRKYVVRRTY